MSNKLHQETFEIPPEVAEKVQAVADDRGLTFEEAAKLLIRMAYDREEGLHNGKETS